MVWSDNSHAVVSCTRWVAQQMQACVCVCVGYKPEKQLTGEAKLWLLMQRTELSVANYLAVKHRFLSGSCTETIKEEWGFKVKSWVSLTGKIHINVETVGGSIGVYKNPLWRCKLFFIHCMFLGNYELNIGFIYFFVSSWSKWNLVHFIFHYWCQMYLFCRVKCSWASYIISRGALLLCLPLNPL